MIQFTDQQKINKKVGNRAFEYMLVLSKFQYKQCLCIMMYPKCNVKFIAQIPKLVANK